MASIHVKCTQFGVLKSAFGVVLGVEIWFFEETWMSMMIGTICIPWWALNCSDVSGRAGWLLD